MTLRRRLSAALAAATALVAMGGCTSQATTEGDFLRSARLILTGTSLNDEPDDVLVGYAHAICRDLKAADSPEDVAQHDLESLAGGVTGIADAEGMKGPIGRFTYRAVETYCPDFTQLNAITAWKNRSSGSTPEPSDTVAAPDPAPEVEQADPAPASTPDSTPVSTPAPAADPKPTTARTTGPAPAAPSRGTLKVGTWRTLNADVAVAGPDGMVSDDQSGAVRLLEARITQTRDADADISVPTLSLRVRNDTDATLTFSLEASFSGDIEAWFGGTAGSPLSVAPGAARTFTLPYNNISGYAVPQFPSSYRLENMTVTAHVES